MKKKKYLKRLGTGILGLVIASTIITTPFLKAFAQPSTEYYNDALSTNGAWDETGNQSGNYSVESANYSKPQSGMVALLRDPRISVVIGFHNNDRSQGEYAEICETELIEKLIGLGFHHVVNSVIVRKNTETFSGVGGGGEYDGGVSVDIAQRWHETDNYDVVRESEYIERESYSYEREKIDIYIDGRYGADSGLDDSYPNKRGKSGINVGDYIPNTVTDYIVFGKLSVESRIISLPKYKELNKRNGPGYIDSGLKQSLVGLDISILKSDAGSVVGNFRTEAKKIHAQSKEAELIAVKEASEEAAIRLNKMFNRAASDTFSAVTVTLRANDYDLVNEFLQRLEILPGVRRARLKGFTAGKGTVIVETNMSPRELYDAIRGNIDISTSLENASAGTMEISLINTKENSNEN